MSVFVRGLLILSLLLFVAPGGSVPSALAAGPTIGALRAAGAAEVQNVYVRQPSGGVADGQPVQVVIALHGMGGSGTDFGNGLAAEADRYGWLVVAPTIAYGDWTDPLQVRHEDPALVAWLADYVRNLSDRTGYSVQPTVLLFGHSRGAQLALRFSVIHPELVAGVAAVSAGTYTLPVVRDVQTGKALEFPFGVANLARDDGGKPFNVAQFRSIPIWIGVGANDSNPADVPAAWTPFIGDDRVDRAEAFSQALQDLGVRVTLAEFSGTDHSLTDAMRGAGCVALAQVLGQSA